MAQRRRYAVSRSRTRHSLESPPPAQAATVLRSSSPSAGNATEGRCAVLSVSATPSRSIGMNNEHTSSLNDRSRIRARSVSWTYGRASVIRSLMMPTWIAESWPLLRRTLEARDADAVTSGLRHWRARSPATQISETWRALVKAWAPVPIASGRHRLTLLGVYGYSLTVT